MTTEYTLPYDPFLLLERTSNVHSFSEDNQQILWRGAGSTLAYTLESNQGKPAQDIKLDTRSLYISDQGIPKLMRIDVEDGDCYTIALTDGISYSGDCTDNDYMYYSFYIETLSVTQRNELSSLPIALINYKYYETEDDYSSWEYSYSGPNYDPAVIYFKKDKDRSLLESTREFISGDNSDYYEGVFQFDINGDGLIPSYRPSSTEIYTPELLENGGKRIAAKKSDEKTKGTNKNDEITGSNGDNSLLSKKGDDLLYGRKGDDYLSGGKGDDFLNGGPDDDILAGGKDADVFKISKGIDTINDFSLEEGDRIAVDSDKFSDLEILANPSGALISVSGLGQMVVTGISATTMEDNFEALFVKYIAK